MKQTLYFILIILINYACTEPVPETDISEPSQVEEYLTIPFDTTEVIASLNIVDYMNRLDLIDSDTTSGLYDKIDTIICHYIVYGCTCPGWKEIEYKDCTAVYSTDEYNYPLHQYYIEPVIDELNIDKNVSFSAYSTSVMFIGRKYKTPYKDGEMGEGSWAGQRFRYYYYEVIPPYTIYGPPILDTNKDIGFQEEPTFFEVKELQTKKE